MPTLGAYISDGVYSTYDALAKKIGISKSNLVSQAVITFKIINTCKKCTKLDGCQAFLVSGCKRDWWLVWCVFCRQGYSTVENWNSVPQWAEVLLNYMEVFNGLSHIDNTLHRLDDLRDEMRLLEGYISWRPSNKRGLLENFSV